MTKVTDFWDHCPKCKHPMGRTFDGATFKGEKVCDGCGYREPDLVLGQIILKNWGKSSDQRTDES